MNRSQLYIPHGSDESLIVFLLSLSLVTLYPTWFRWKQASELPCPLCCLFFISHMVQMKAVYASSTACAWNTLYPTWFRWKPSFRLPCSIYITFISHMVQMKVCYINLSWKLSVRLYIPHGSDESSTCFSCPHHPHQLYIPHGSDESLDGSNDEKPLSILYIPHGSDERSKIGKRPNTMIIFISHMVQMKGGGGEVKDLQCLTLYPTWFRWKLFLC